MATTLTSILLHVTYSTKRRAPTLPLELLPDLFEYTGGICRDRKSVLMHAGGVENHVHLLVSLGKTMAVSELLQHIKGDSSIWVKNQRGGLHGFAWQDGYFAFSVGHDNVDAVRTYFDRQEEHHRHIDFKQEVVAFLRKYGVEFDERYLWD